ncbi:Xanthine phosphoribosyltransferase 1 [Mortierella claussenii]|nr:Xanthine phosphoribosyltransferase 1 [Mortierella claussenii]
MATATTATTTTAQQQQGQPDNHAPLGTFNSRPIPTWMMDWIQHRILDASAATSSSHHIVLDLVYTWVNGSDPTLTDMKERYKALSPLFQPTIDMANGAGQVNKQSDQSANRFRDMNELKYSVRSVAEYAARDFFRKTHILTTEAVMNPSTGQQQGQVPQWLDFENAKDIIELVPHSHVYDDQHHLPSFNSLSIESQMHHIPDLADVFVYLNDDMFFGRPLSASDFWTPLYGFVFHVDPTTTVQPHIPEPLKIPTSVDEWPSLQYTNALLSKQFGARHRVYIAHIPHVLSVPIMDEIQATWPEEFAKTSSHRFRGEGQAHDIQVSFLLAHYVMERQRETQLKSYWKYRLDKNQDGRLDWEERQQLIRAIDHYHAIQQADIKGLSQLKNTTFASFLETYSQKLESVGIPMYNETKYLLAGLDEYPFMSAYSDTSKSSTDQPLKPYLLHQRKRQCRFDIDHCLGPEFRNGSIEYISGSTGNGSIFERMAFTEFHCGDCLLHLLRQERSTLGLSAMMPLDRSSDVYQEVLSDLIKYNYVVGFSDFSFLQLKNGVQADRALKMLMRQRDTKAFFCINDDVQDNPLIVQRVRKVFGEFLHTRFPIRSPWEKQAEV